MWSFKNCVRHLRIQSHFLLWLLLKIRTLPLLNVHAAETPTHTERKSKSSSVSTWCVPACSYIMCFLVFLSGMGTRILRSNLLRAAMSSSQGMFVVAKTDTRSSMCLMLSICFRNSVFIRRSVSLSLPVLFLPRESISSIKIIEGECSLASSKRRARSFSLSPINLEVISAKDTQKQVALLC